MRGPSKRLGIDTLRANMVSTFRIRRSTERVSALAGFAFADGARLNKSRLVCVAFRSIGRAVPMCVRAKNPTKAEHRCVRQRVHRAAPLPRPTAVFASPRTRGNDAALEDDGESTRFASCSCDRRSLRRIVRSSRRFHVSRHTWETEVLGGCRAWRNFHWASLERAVAT